MGKLKKSLIYILASSTVFMGGCFNSNSAENPSKNTNSKEAVTSKEENQRDESTETIQKNEQTEAIHNDELTKQLYLKKLDELDVNLKTLLEEKYNSPVTQDMLDSANEEYRQWDNMLNEIYSQLKEQLSQEDMDKLTDEQLKWIDDRDAKSKEAGNSNKGGSIAPLNSVISLIDSTKKRCYELVNQYMK